MANAFRVTKPSSPSSMITQPHEVCSQTMDENEVLARLTDQTNPSVRVAVIEDLRASVRRNGGRLMFEDRHGLFHVFQGSLCDSDPNFRVQCIDLLSEIIPEFGPDLDNCMTLILPQLVSNLGNHTVTVKKSAIQTLHVYMKNSSNVGAVFNAIIEHGLESEDKRTRTESLVALPILITPNLAHEDLFILTKALVEILEGSSRPQPTVLSLHRIRNVVGEEKFNDYLRRLPSNQQKICSEAIQKFGPSYREDMETSNLRKAKSASHLNTNGVLGSNEESVNGEKHNFDRGHTIAVTKGYSGRENIKFNNGELVFGFVPQSVIAKLRDQSNWRIRAQGIEELKTVMGYLGDPTPALPHLASLFGLILDFLDDINFKITVTSLQILGILISKLGQSAKPFLKPLVNTLTNKLGDNKIVIRQENMKVLMQLMQILSPKPVLNVLTASLQHPKSKVREETLNVVIGALLTFPRSDFDLPELTNAIAPSLADSKRKVRQAALEAFAVIAQAMGPGHLSPIVTAVDKVELTRGGDGVMAAVQARLARRQLPRLNSDGLVEYAIPVPSSGTVRGQNNSQRGADIEWVMAGTGGSSSADVTNSARSTPGLNDSMNNSGPSPRRYYSAGRNRLPWEDAKDSVVNQVSDENSFLDIDDDDDMILKMHDDNNMEVLISCHAA